MEVGGLAGGLDVGFHHRVSSTAALCYSDRKAVEDILYT